MCNTVISTTLYLQFYIYKHAYIAMLWMNYLQYRIERRQSRFIHLSSIAHYRNRARGINPFTIIIDNHTFIVEHTHMVFYLLDMFHKCLCMIDTTYHSISTESMWIAVSVVGITFIDISTVLVDHIRMYASTGILKHL